MDFMVIIALLVSLITLQTFRNSTFQSSNI